MVDITNWGPKAKICMWPNSSELQVVPFVEQLGGDVLDTPRGRLQQFIAHWNGCMSLARHKSLDGRAQCWVTGNVSEIQAVGKHIRSFPGRFLHELLGTEDCSFRESV